MKKTILNIVLAALCPFDKDRDRNLLRLRTKNYMLTLLFLCMITTLKGQDQIKILPMRVGDKVSPAFWEFKHQIYKNETFTVEDLSAYKGKLLLLDFWATWCGNCVKNFPKLTTIQKKLGNQIQVLLVNCANTNDTGERVKLFYTEKGELFNGKPLPTIVLDTFLKNSFPHRFIPHYVWISPQGKIAAFTDSDLISESALQQIISTYHSKAK